jgi:hypothetical protein
MRCPSCGTDNAQDSRFCGGCGARLGASSRVAPTQKISDDASFPQPVAPPPAAGAQALAPVRGIPPTSQRPPGAAALAPVAPLPAAPRATPAVSPHPPSALTVAPIAAPQPSPPGTPPPTGYLTPTSAAQPVRAVSAPLGPRAASAAPVAASISMPIAARRPWGLIAAVLLLDIGLAVAGSWLLSQGLHHKSGTGSAAPPLSGASTSK